MERMQAESRRGKRWRRFRHKYGGLIVLSLAVLCILGLVAGMIYLLSSPDYRVRP